MRKSIRKLLVTTGISMVLAMGMAMTSYAGQWNQTGYGWWYDNGNGSYTINDWQYIDNTWYYFNQDGYMRTGWIPVNGKWYYCYGNGAMAHDTWIDGKYYVGSDGTMYTNTTTPDGYKVDGNGLYIDKSSSKVNVSESKKSYTYDELKNELGMYPNLFALWTLQTGCTEILEVNVGSIEYSYPFEDIQYQNFIDMYQWAMRDDDGWKSSKIKDTRIRRPRDIGRNYDYYNVISCSDADDIIYEYFGAKINSDEIFQVRGVGDLNKKVNESEWYHEFECSNPPKCGSLFGGYDKKTYYTVGSMDWDNATIKVNEFNDNIIDIHVGVKGLNLNKRKKPIIDLQLYKADNLLGCKLYRCSVDIPFK